MASLNAPQASHAMVAVILCVADATSVAGATSVADATSVAGATSVADATSIIAWPGGIERHYENGRLPREGGPAVVIKGTYEAWYQRGDPHRIGAAAFTQAISHAHSRERCRIVDSRCAHMVLDVYYIDQHK